jgi:hypothetical protein
MIFQHNRYDNQLETEFRRLAVDRVKAASARVARRIHTLLTEVSIEDLPLAM